MAKCSFSISFQGSADSVIQQAKKAVDDAGGTFTGDSHAGSFEITSPVTIKGQYTVKDQNVNITILEKPFFVSCTKIETELRKRFSNGNATESVAAASSTDSLFTTVVHTSPVLSEVDVRFNTADIEDNTPDNSNLHIRLSINHPGGFTRDIAHSAGYISGEFSAGTTTNIALVVTGTTTLDQLGAPIVRVDFDPDGKGTWTFSCDLKLTFTDGTVLTRLSTRLNELNAVNRSIDIPE